MVDCKSPVGQVQEHTWSSREDGQDQTSNNLPAILSKTSNKASSKKKITVKPSGSVTTVSDQQAVISDWAIGTIPRDGLVQELSGSPSEKPGSSTSGAAKTDVKRSRWKSDTCEWFSSSEEKPFEIG